MTAIARERVHAMESLAGIIAHELRAGVPGVTSAAQRLPVEDGWWTSTLSSRGTATASRPESGRPALMMVFCHRSIVAHGGEVVDMPAGDRAPLMKIRLPLSLHAE